MSLIAQVGTLEALLFDLIAHGSNRCAVGFGKYPLGILFCVTHLLPLCDCSKQSRIDGPTLEEAYARFARRLEPEEGDPR